MSDWIFFDTTDGEDESPEERAQKKSKQMSTWMMVLTGLLALLLLWWLASLLSKIGSGSGATCQPSSAQAYQQAQAALDRAWAAWSNLPEGSGERQAWLGRLVEIGKPIKQPCVSQSDAEQTAADAQSATSAINSAAAYA